MCKQVKCNECAAIFAPARAGQVFCSKECKIAFSNRETVRGRSVVTMMRAWRKTRGKGDTAKKAFFEVCRQLDAWNSEDLKAGRVNPETHVARQFEGALNKHFRA